MAVTQYVGARYVPLFADPLDWDDERTYEPLTIVYYGGNSYTSKQYVPAGIQIGNEEYWALTGNYNAQIEQYRAEVAAYDQRITQAQTDATQALDKANGDAPIDHASADTTYGVGTSALYGHVKLTDTLADTPASEGVAASPQMVYDVDAAQTAAVNEKAPINHASAAATYGAASSTDYGHVRITSEPDGTSADTALSQAGARLLMPEHRYQSMGVISDSWATGYYSQTSHTSDGFSIKLRNLLGVSADKYRDASVNGSGIGDNVSTTFSDQADTIHAALGEPDLLIVMGGQNDRSEVGSSGLASYTSKVQAFFSKLNTLFPSSEIHIFVCPLGYNHVDSGISVMSPYITIRSLWMQYAQYPNMTVHDGCCTWGNWVGSSNADSDTRHLLANGYTLVANKMFNLITRGGADFWDCKSLTGSFTGEATSITSQYTRCMYSNGMVMLNIGGNNGGSDITATTSNQKAIFKLPAPFGSLQTRIMSTTTRGASPSTCQFSLSGDTLTLVSGTWGSGCLLGLNFTFPCGS